MSQIHRRGGEVEVELRISHLDHGWIPQVKLGENGWETEFPSTRSSAKTRAGRLHALRGTPLLNTHPTWRSLADGPIMGAVNLL